MMKRRPHHGFSCHFTLTRQDWRSVRAVGSPPHAQRSEGAMPETLYAEHNAPSTTHTPINVVMPRCSTARRPSPVASCGPQGSRHLRQETHIALAARLDSPAEHALRYGPATPDVWV